jgi:membrane associated rhomboid family serine protease
MQPTPPPAGGPDPAYGLAGCYRHPDRLTGVRCVRCNRPICPECMNAAAVGFQCPDDVKAGAATVRTTRTIVGATYRNHPPFVSYGLIALNVVVYLATALSPGGNIVENTNTTLFHDWQLWPNAVGYLHQYHRMITAAFLHIGPLHLILNMTALYFMGPGLERLLGWWRFAALYLVSAFGGSVAVLLLGDARQPVAGASGAIYGLFAAAWILSKVIGVDTRPMTITIAINFIFTLSVPGISLLGHVGGFVLGGLATMALLGWTLQTGTLKNRTASIQAAGLAGLLVLLIALTAWRAHDISQQPLPTSARYQNYSDARSPSSTVWTALGRTTPV